MAFNILYTASQQAASSAGYQAGKALEKLPVIVAGPRSVEEADKRTFQDKSDRSAFIEGWFQGNQHGNEVTFDTWVIHHGSRRFRDSVLERMRALNIDVHTNAAHTPAEWYAIADRVSNELFAEGK